MEQYTIEKSSICVEEKTFIDDKGQAHPYKDYSLLLNINDNVLMVKLDKSSKAQLQTLIDLKILK